MTGSDKQFLEVPIENVQLTCKDLPANPCREIVRLALPAGQS
jgi:hypothetical protein